VRIRGAALVGVVVLAGLSGINAAGAVAAHAKCQGKNATIVSSASVIHDTPRSDVIIATGAGPHTIVWSGGHDAICGAGNDTIDYSQVNAATTGYVIVFVHSGNFVGQVFHEPRTVLEVNSRGNTVKTTIGTKSTDTISGVSTIIGSPNDDWLFGDVGTHLYGGGGSDYCQRGGTVGCDG